MKLSRSGGVDGLAECKYADRQESGRPECKHPSMMLYVGLYCDPEVCERVKKSEVKQI
jgi:hypothetical protein